MKYVLILFASTILVGCGGSAPTSTNDPLKGRYVITMIPKGEQHAFWRTVKRGAESVVSTQDNRHVSLRWEPPTIDDNVDFQIEQMELAVSNARDAFSEEHSVKHGIIIAPLDEERLLESVLKAAEDPRIPVVVMDSELQGRFGEEYASFVATNNFEAGEEAGKSLLVALQSRDASASTASQISDSGESKASAEAKKTDKPVWALVYKPGSGSTSRRAVGFSTEMRKKNVRVEFFGQDSFPNYMRTRSTEPENPAWAANNEFAEHAAKGLLLFLALDKADFDAIVDPRGFNDSWSYLGGPQEEDASSQRSIKSAGMKSRIKERASGFFCPNESTSTGLLRALEQCGLSGEYPFIGFDVSNDLLQGLRDSKLDALIVQDAFEIGARSTRKLLLHLKNDPNITSDGDIVKPTVITRKKLEEKSPDVLQRLSEYGL